MDRAIIMKIMRNDMKLYHFNLARVSLCHMPAQENLKSKIIINQVQNYLKDRGPPRDTKFKGPKLTEIHQDNLSNQTC